MERVDVADVPANDATIRRIGHVWTPDGIRTIDLTGGNFPRYVIVDERTYEFATWRNGEAKVFRGRRSHAEFLAYYVMATRNARQLQEAPHGKENDPGTEGGNETIVDSRPADDATAGATADAPPSATGAPVGARRSARRGKGRLGASVARADGV